MRHPSKLALSFRPSAALKPLSAFRFSEHLFYLIFKKLMFKLTLIIRCAWLAGEDEEPIRREHRVPQQVQAATGEKGHSITLDFKKSVKVEKTTDRLALDKSRRTSRGHLADIWRASGVSNWKAGIWGRDGNWTEHGNGAGLENDWNSSSSL